MNKDAHGIVMTSGIIVEFGGESKNRMSEFKTAHWVDNWREKDCYS